MTHDELDALVAQLRRVPLDYDPDDQWRFTPVWQLEAAADAITALRQENGDLAIKLADAAPWKGLYEGQKLLTELNEAKAEAFDAIEQLHRACLYVTIDSYKGQVSVRAEDFETVQMTGLGDDLAAAVAALQREGDDD